MKSESKGILVAVSAYFLYSLAVLCIKLTPCSYQLIVFSRSFVGLLLFLLFLMPKDNYPWKSERKSGHLLRSIVSISSIFCSTYGIKRLALVDAILLENTLPLFTPLIMLVKYNRKISKQGLLAIGIGFVGVFLILKPKLALLQFASFASLGAGFLASMSLVLVHDLSKTEKRSTILFYFLLFSTFASSISLTINPVGITNPLILMPLILIGGFFLLYQFLITKAYSYASPNTICGFSYLTVAFSLLWEKLFWSVPIDLFSLIGSSLVVSAGFLILWEKGLQKRLTILNRFLS